MTSVIGCLKADPEISSGLDRAHSTAHWAAVYLHTFELFKLAAYLHSQDVRRRAVYPDAVESLVDGAWFV